MSAIYMPGDDLPPVQPVAAKPKYEVGRAYDFYHLDDVGNIIHEIKQDVEPHLEWCANMRSAGLTGSSEMRLAAHFPDAVVRNYCNQKGIDLVEFNRDRVHIRNMLQDPDLSKFRIWQGRI